MESDPKNSIPFQRCKEKDELMQKNFAFCKTAESLH